jgi:solute carrier family 25 (mitochondrial carnitine/acylcarnitine transporter), member 20/29
MEKNNDNSFVAGLITGISQTIIGYPLDTIKVNLQSNNYKSYNYKNINYKNINYKNLYKGISYPLYTNSFITSIQFGVFNSLKNNDNSLFMSSFGAGFFTGIITAPIDRFKIKKQISANNIYYKPFKGVTLSLLREIPANIIYFNIYYKFREEYGILFSGGLAGVLSWALTYPIDVLKTRIQSDKFNNLHHAISKKSLFKGFIPCISRALIVNSLGFYVYEKTISIL